MAHSHENVIISILFYVRGHNEHNAGLNNLISFRPFAGWYEYSMKRCGVGLRRIKILKTPRESFHPQGKNCVEQRSVSKNTIFEMNRFYLRCRKATKPRSADHIRRV